MNLEKDWRIDAVSDPGDGVRVFDGEKLLEGADIVVVDPIRLKSGKVLALPIPNATAMLLNSSFRTFKEAESLLNQEELRNANQEFVQFRSSSDAINCIELLVTSVVSAYSAIESFANEWIPEWYLYKKADKKASAIRELSKEEMERELQLGLKLHQVLPPNFRCLSPKGTKVWEQYIDLERVRNRLVHLKTDDRQSRDLDEDTIWKSLAGIAPPYRTAKLLVDHYFAGIAHVPGLSYDELRPVRPRWHVKCPTELGK